MAKFAFRLQKVLEYREYEEEWAKQTYLDAKATRIKVEAEILSIQHMREDVLRQPALSLNEYRAIEETVLRFDDMETEAELQKQAVMVDEQRAETAWQSKHQEVEILKTLREEELEEFNKEEAKKEQAELDEWAVLRRAA